MKCEACDADAQERRTTAERPYLYTIGGLPRVGLVGVTVYMCPRCDAGERVVIPKLGQLHEVIARALVRKPRLLDGDELRFIRKHAGFPAIKFAALLGIDPAHLSRVENGKVASLGASTDRLARAIVMAAKGDPAVKEFLLAQATAGGVRKRSLFKIEQNRWKEHAA